MGSKVFDIKERSFQFSLSVVKLVSSLPKDALNQVFSNQLLRSATSIGANIAEAQPASSKKEFVKFYLIALESAVETKYWLRLIGDAGLASREKIEPYLKEVEEISKILGSIVSKRKT